MESRSSRATGSSICLDWDIKPNQSRQPRHSLCEVVFSPQEGFYLNTGNFEVKRCCHWPDESVMWYIWGDISHYQCTCSSVDLPQSFSCAVSLQFCIYYVGLGPSQTLKSAPMFRILPIIVCLVLHFIPGVWYAAQSNPLLGGSKNICASPQAEYVLLYNSNRINT